MTRPFRSKSFEFVARTEFTPSPPKEREHELVGEDDHSRKPISKAAVTDDNQSHSAILDSVVEALKKSLVTCSVEKQDDSSLDIGWPTEVRHVSHVTFDRLHGFLGLPAELEPEVSCRSASAKVFGVSAESMERSYDDRGNCVPTILLSMQKQLYSEGGLQVEGIFRINAESSQEEHLRHHLNKGVAEVPHGTDVHCWSGLIKAWFRELPTRLLDSLTPQQLLKCTTQEDCANLVKLLAPTEASLLHWVIDLMADVVQHQDFNKMNSHNIATVFAPNMTQMGDPLTALTHAVQVVNFLKTLILKVLRERGLSPCSDSGLNEECGARKPRVKDNNLLRSSTLGRIEWMIKEKLWGSEESESVVRDDDIRPSRYRRLRKQIHRLWRNPVILWNKAIYKPATSTLAGSF